MPTAVAAASRTETLRQCAWCGRVVDHSGRYGPAPQPWRREATHGICPPCKARVRAEIEAE